jgi:hypothetical protein
MVGVLVQLIQEDLLLEVLVEVAALVLVVLTLQVLHQVLVEMVQLLQ